MSEQVTQSVAVPEPEEPKLSRWRSMTPEQRAKRAAQIAVWRDEHPHDVEREREQQRKWRARQSIEKRQHRAAQMRAWRERNKEYVKAQDKLYREAHPDRHKGRKQKPHSSKTEAQKIAIRARRHGLTHDEFVAMFAVQHGLCAICEKPLNSLDRNSVPEIDHDHATGLVRAILCHPCNIGLGGFRDSVDSLSRAHAYLKRHKEQDAD